MLKTPIGMALGAGVLILALSPEARKAARKWAVKGTEKALDLAEQLKSIASEARTISFVTQPKQAAIATGEDLIAEQLGTIHTAEH